MRLPIQLQYKVQIGLVLTILMIAIVINNLSSRYNLNVAGSSITSIYNDRLMAATYLFELSGNLHEKELLVHNAPKMKATAIDKNISLLIRKYENTMLTRQEAALWQNFKSSLYKYNLMSSDGVNRTQNFNQAIYALKQLSALQVREGDFLYKNTRSSLSATTLGTYLEIILAILTGIIVLFLIGISKKTLDTFSQSPSLN